jgi:cell division protein FtsB
MNTLLLVYSGFLTLFIVGGIHYYEDKVKDLEASIGDYERALKLSKTHSNGDHYAHLQIENKKLIKDIQYLSDANDHLLAENKSLRKHNNELINVGIIQYESQAYKSNTHESPVYKDTEKI